MRFSLSPVAPTSQDIDVLRSYSWPGNIRELGAVIDRAAILGEGHSLEIGAALGFSVESTKIQLTSPPVVASVHAHGSNGFSDDQGIGSLDDALAAAHQSGGSSERLRPHRRPAASRPCWRSIPTRSARGSVSSRLIGRVPRRLKRSSALAASLLTPGSARVGRRSGRHRGVTPPWQSQGLNVARSERARSRSALKNKAPWKIPR